MKLETSVQFVKKVGEVRAALLSKAGIRNLDDLLRYPPMRYEDRTRLKPIASLEAEETAAVVARVAACGEHRAGPRRIRLFEAVAEDQSGRLALKFFNRPGLEKVLTRGVRGVFFGTIRYDKYSRGLALTNPEFEVLEEEDETGSPHIGRIVPVYRRISSLTPRILRTIISNALDALEKAGGRCQDPLPEELRRRYGFPSLPEAFRQLHFPQPGGARTEALLKQLEDMATPVQQRFIYEDLFAFQSAVQVVRSQRTRLRKGRRIELGEKERRTLKSILPFRPTRAQKRVLGEIVRDLARPEVMSRLLQGDVGSGKTIVALQAMAVAMENGYQAALMAPTEILAEQHWRSLSPLLHDRTRFRAGYLTSAVQGGQRENLLNDLKEGKIDLLIGTHALIEDPVDFHRLGMIVVDEQHRFGVMQRSRLMEKGPLPDVLVMTATPIPRSLALTLYGDLDLSVLDELPPGRRPVETVLAGEKKRAEIYRGLRRQIEKGRQAYVVYPLVEESEKVDLKAAVEMAAHLQEKVFPDLRVGLLHGRLKSDEKEAVMKDFVAGRYHILVSTTVIEVGVDVPNASIMVIEHAERFGLSQLHQLRGRIGRGSHDSYCVLMIGPKVGQKARQRLLIMRESNDGFEIAEKDLELRGPGEFIGTRQSGLPEFAFANLVRDRQWVSRSHQDARHFIEESLRREGGDRQRLLKRLKALFKGRLPLARVG